MWDEISAPLKVRPKLTSFNRAKIFYKLNSLACYIALVCTEYLTSLEGYRRLDFQEEFLTLIQPHWSSQVFDYLALQQKHHTLQIHVPFSPHVHPLYWEFTVNVFWFSVSSDIYKCKVIVIMIHPFILLWFATWSFREQHHQWSLGINVVSTMGNYTLI